MAPFVRMAFDEEIRKGDLHPELQDIVIEHIEINDYNKEDYNASDVINKIKLEEQKLVRSAIEKSIKETVKRTHQAMESFIHNMNTMHSRGGNQVVFSSINYGTDTSPEGRLVMRELLNSTLKGVGNGETPVFPIQIFKMKRGVNKNENDPNYDLFELACKCTARRFYPNFSNLDTEFNRVSEWKKDDPERYKHEVSLMGCRSRVFENLHGNKTSIGRGNLSFSTINLPGLAFKAKQEEPYDTINYFNGLLNDLLDDTAEQLYERYQFQTTAKVKQFPMLMNGMWVDSEDYDNEDYVGDVLKHGTLGIGFIGLAECLILLTGEHHGENEKSQQMGLSIIEMFNKRVNHYKSKYDLNYSVFATPAEGLSGKFTKIDRAKYGIVENVTDKEYYTNSNHIPVWYECTAKHKAEIEGAYHKLTPGGHIFYIEVDGDLTHNHEAIMDLVKLIDKNEIGYMAINHNRNHCLNCGYEDSEKDLKTCPSCGEAAIDSIQRITG